jgi:integrase
MSGKDRKIPMTARLYAALKRIGTFAPNGFSVTRMEVCSRSAFEAALRYACKRAGLRQIGTHILRHTFCSHLAMRGAEGDPRARGALHARDDDAVHAFGADRVAASDRTFGFCTASGQSGEGRLVK